jgi:cysteine desulfurase
MNPPPIYLDNAATTAVDPRVIAAMSSCLGSDGDFANPSSANHVYGREAGARVDGRAEVTAGNAGQILFTSGATEA